MQFYGRYFETDDCIVLKFCHHINSSALHLHSEFDVDILLQYIYLWILIVKTHTKRLLSCGTGNILNIVVFSETESCLFWFLQSEARSCSGDHILYTPMWARRGDAVWQTTKPSNKHSVSNDLLVEFGDSKQS